jgi:phospholipid transport system substrate-binding protein
VSVHRDRIIAARAIVALDSRSAKPRTDRRNAPGTVYVIEGAAGLYKIGFTAGSVGKRLRQLQTGNPTALRGFINGELTKTFDRDYAARLVLGVHGRGASDADVKLFADAMADNLMQRYGSALLDIQGKPSFRLKSEAPLPGNRGVKVSTELVRAGSEATPVDYLMRNVNGQWKIFDVMIEGISYVQTFKTQFDAPLRQKSIQQVATELRNGSMQAAPSGK